MSLLSKISKLLLSSLLIVGIVADVADARRGPRPTESRPEIRSERSEVPGTGQTRGQVERQERARAQFEYPARRATNETATEPQYEAPKYSRVFVDAEFFRFRLDELDRTLEGSVLVLNIAGSDAFISKRIAQLRDQGELSTEVVAVEPNPAIIRQIVEATPKERPVVVLAHVIGDRTRLANLQETKSVDWAQVEDIFTGNDRVAVVMGCQSACMRGATAGVRGVFDELAAIEAFRSFESATTIGDVYSALGKAGDGFFLSSTAAGYEGRGKTREGDSIWASVLSSPRAVQLTPYEQQIENKACGSRSGERRAQCMRRSCWSVQFLFLPDPFERDKTLPSTRVTPPILAIPGDLDCQTRIGQAATMSLLCLSTSSGERRPLRGLRELPELGSWCPDPTSPNYRSRSSGGDGLGILALLFFPATGAVLSTALALVVAFCVLLARLSEGVLIAVKSSISVFFSFLFDGGIFVGMMFVGMPLVFLSFAVPFLGVPILVLIGVGTFGEIQEKINETLGEKRR